MTALAEPSSNCKLQTRLLVKEGAHINKPELSNSNTNLVMGSRWVPDTKIDWPAERQP
jgi:hypothetical protein